MYSYRTILSKSRIKICSYLIYLGYICEKSWTICLYYYSKEKNITPEIIKERTISFQIKQIRFFVPNKYNLIMFLQSEVEYNDHNFMLEFIFGTTTKILL